MDGSRRTIGLVVATTLVVCGCTSSPWSVNRTTSSPSPGATEPSVAAETPSGQPDPQTIREIVAEMERFGPLDPATRQELLTNLQQTSPQLWPLVSQQFRAALAYRRRTEERESAALAAGPGRVGNSPQPGKSGEPGPDPPKRQEIARLGPAEGAFLRDAAGPGRDAPLPPADRAARATDAPRGDPRQPEPGAPAEQSVRQSSPDRQLADGPDRRVVAASYRPESLGDWRGQVLEAIRVLESNVCPSPQSPSEVAQHARLRMLYLITSRRNDALQPIPSLSPAMQDFWSKELYGLATLLDTELIAEPARRTAEAKRHLSEAVTRLGESSPLEVRNLAFVTEVESYGAFKPFEEYEFVPGQKVLLYAEVENFKSKETARGFHTALRSSYEIFDSRGQRVADHEFNANEECCRNPRRDYFIGYEFSLSKRIDPGKHVLQLTVADLNSQKIGQSSIEFTVKRGDE